MSQERAAQQGPVTGPGKLPGSCGRCFICGCHRRKEIDLLCFGDKMRRAAQLPTLSWHGRSSAVGLPPCSLPPQDLGHVLDGGPIRLGVDSQQLVVPRSPPTACTGTQQGCQLVCPAAGTFWWCWLSPFVLHPAPPMSPHDLLLSQRLRLIPKNSTYCSYPKFFLHPQGGGCIFPVLPAMTLAKFLSSGRPA